MKWSMLMSILSFSDYFIFQQSLQSRRADGSLNACEAWGVADLLIDNNSSCLSLLATKIAAESTRADWLRCIFDTNYVLCDIAASVNADWSFLSSISLMPSSSCETESTSHARLIYLLEMHSISRVRCQGLEPLAPSYSTASCGLTHADLCPAGNIRPTRKSDLSTTSTKRPLATTRLSVRTPPWPQDPRGRTTSSVFLIRYSCLEPFYFIDVFTTAMISCFICHS